jgi:hypothetical protein|nr:MAG TPA: hypothetical protein [Caudoviricetes sp.]
MGRQKEDTLSALKKDRTLSKLEFYRNVNRAMMNMENLYRGLLEWIVQKKKE